MAWNWCFRARFSIALDYAPLQGFMLVMAGIFLLVNLITDLTYTAIDPRAGGANG